MKIEKNINQFFLTAKRNFFIIFSILIITGFFSPLVSLILKNKLTNIDIIVRSVVILIGIFSFILILLNKPDIGMIILLFSIMIGRSIIGITESIIKPESFTCNLAQSFGSTILYIIIIGFFINHLFLTIFSTLSVLHFFTLGILNNFFSLTSAINLVILLIILIVFVFYFSILQQKLMQKSKEEAESQKVLVKEKEALLKEIHHRVKNNMQIMYSLNRLQSRTSTDENTSNILQSNRDRIKAMSLVHELLYQSENVSKVSIKDYIIRLTNSIFDQYKIIDYISTDIIIEEELNLNLDTIIPVGLIINEILINSIRHAYPKNEKGTIQIKLNNIKDDLYSMTISDDGIGISDNIDIYQTESLGLQLIVGLTKQLRGRIILNNENGTEYQIEFHEVSPFIRS